MFMVIAVIILGILVVILLVVVLRKPIGKNDSASALLLKQDLTQISEDINKMKDNLHTQLGDRFDKNQEMMKNSLVRVARLLLKSPGT
jgi:hypothetical protein